MCAMLHFFVNLNIFNKPASMCSIHRQIFSIFSIQSTVTSNFRASCIIPVVVAVSSNHVLWILFIFRNDKLLMNLNMVWWHYTQAEIEHSTICTFWRLASTAHIFSHFCSSTRSRHLRQDFEPQLPQMWCIKKEKWRVGFFILLLTLWKMDQ